ncbi:hypothetical protein Tco_0695574 [Tanacetum coccineum]
MLGKKPNKVYDPFLKAGLGYKNSKRLKKAITAQPKMYNGDMLHCVNLKMDSPDSEETLEDAKESQLKMRNKMVQIYYGKLNALYETFVPQQEFSVEQTYFLVPSNSDNGSKSKDVTSDLPIPKMPKESKLLKMFDTIGVAINGLQARINKTLLEDRERRWISDSQNSLRDFYNTDVILMSKSLYKNLKELKEVHEMLNIFESMEQQVKEKSPKEYILQNEIDRLLEVSLTSVESSNSVRRPKSKDIKSKNRVLKSAYVWKISSSVIIDSNKCEIKDSNEWHTNASVLNSKTVNAVNDVKFKNVGATSVVGKSRFSVAKTPTTTNKVIQLVLWIVDSGCSKHMTDTLQLLRNFIEKFMETVRFGNYHFSTISGY